MVTIGHDVNRLLFITARSGIEELFAHVHGAQLIPAASDNKDGHSDVLDGAL